MPNIQVTHGSSLNDARSESVLAINPSNPAQIVGASRKCIDISAYVFTVAAVYSQTADVDMAGFRFASHLWLGRPL